MMGFVVDDRKVEEKWKFCTRTYISYSLMQYTDSLTIQTELSVPY